MLGVMEKKTIKKTLEELTELLRFLQMKEKKQDCMVRTFQKLIRDEGLTSPVIKDFPYPMAIFGQDGDLILLNSSLSEETGLYAADLSKSKHSLLNRITDANLQILDAVENVFMGKTTFLTGLSDPLDIFMSDRSGKKNLSSEYRDAVFFLIAEEDSQVAKGAVIFMK